MAQFNILVNQKTTQDIIINSTELTSCYSLFNITIAVPSGQTRFVNFRATDAYSSPSNSELITADRNYSILIEGDNAFRNSQFELQANTINSVLTLTIRENSASGNIILTQNFGRLHSGNYCIQDYETFN